MKVYSSGIDDNGYWRDIYGKRGQQFGKDGMPTYSIPLEIVDAPAGTRSFAIVLEDKDAVPVCGFVWIHWLVANLTKSSLAENESLSAAMATDEKAAFDARRALRRSGCGGGACPAL